MIDWNAPLTEEEAAELREASKTPAGRRRVAMFVKTMEEERAKEAAK